MDSYLASVVIFLALLALVSGWMIVAYNRLVRLRNRVDAAWAEVDVQLSKRHDLVPNLVAVVQGYAAHERQTLDEVVEARGAAIAARGPQDQAHAENMLTGALGRLFAQAEAYPELKADQNFEELQARLETIENTLAMAATRTTSVSRATRTSHRRSRRTSSRGWTASSRASSSPRKRATGPCRTSNCRPPRHPPASAGPRRGRLRPQSRR